jgi:hypothetical protein
MHASDAMSLEGRQRNVWGQLREYDFARRPQVQRVTCADLGEMPELARRLDHINADTPWQIEKAERN